MILTKICPTCGPKLTTEFFNCRTSKDGLQAHCKTCQAIRKKNKPDTSLSQRIQSDPEAMALIQSATLTGRKYLRADGTRIYLNQELAKLGYHVGSSNLSVIVSKVQGRYLTVGQKRLQNDPNASDMPTAVLTSEPPKPAPNDTLELVIDIPGIFEVQNRGRGYTSYNFTSPVDGSTFTFSSFKDARKGRQAMMTAFEQQAVFESVFRQKTGKKPADDDEEGYE
jgi:hypothetical protein